MVKAREIASQATSKCFISVSLVLKRMPNTPLRQETEGEQKRRGSCGRRNGREQIE
nr:hypothetical protein [Methanophagales archaeon]